MQTVVTLLTIIVFAAVAVGGMYVADKAPVHANLGDWSEILPVLGVTMLVMAVVLAVFGGGAWALSRTEYKMASGMLGMTAVVGGILVWVLCDALNVLLDDSPPTLHEVELVEAVGATAKRKGYYLVTSWRAAAGEHNAIDLPLQAHPLIVGMRLVVTVHAGAFGRPYAVRLELAEPVTR